MMNRFHIHLRRLAWSAVPLLALLVLVAGCDDGELLPPDPEAGDRFARYVALGNSITAGFQSDGINAQTQRNAYPVLLAEQMGHEIGETFTIPALEAPGCPPPLTNILTGEREGGAEAPPCALREQPVPITINNAAVPGAALADVLTNDPEEGANPNALTTVLLGGRTQLEVAEDVQPTFASVWIGNNDVLSAALSGTVIEGTTYTPASTFEARYGQMIDRLTATGAEDGVLVGVADVTLIPYLSSGAAYFQAVPPAQAAEALPPNLEVDGSCETATGNQTLVPFRFGIALINVADALFDPDDPANSPTVTVDCSEDFTVEAAVGQTFGGTENIPPEIDAAIDDVRNVSLLQAPEIEALRDAVQAYNAAIASAAEELGWPYLNPNTLFEQEDIATQIPPFPNLSDPTQPFGPLFSLDGVHPSTEAHVLITNALIEAINEAYDENIPPVSDAE